VLYLDAGGSSNSVSIKSSGGAVREVAAGGQRVGLVAVAEEDAEDAAADINNEVDNDDVAAANELSVGGVYCGPSGIEIHVQVNVHGTSV